jgi:hypothetical protein
MARIVFRANHNYYVWCAHDNDHENDGPRACYNDSKGGTNHDNHNHNSRTK